VATPSLNLATRLLATSALAARVLAPRVLATKSPMTKPPGTKLLATLLAALALAAGLSQGQEAGEYDVKAAYLFNFARFTEWPPPQEGPLQVFLMGRDPFGAPLSALEGRMAQNRPVHIKRDVAVDDMAACQIVFVSDSEARRLKPILQAASAHPTLTMSDIGGFADNGGMVGLYLADQRIQFDVNLAAIRDANLKVPAQVLKLAHQIINPKARP